MKNKVTWMMLALGIVLTAPQANAAFITGITATASSSFDGRPPINMVNGTALDDSNAGLTTAVSTLPGGTELWHTNNVTTGVWVNFDLGMSYDLDSIYIWSHIQPNLIQFTRGFKDVNIEYSVNGTDWTLLTDANGGTAGTHTVPQSSGLGDGYNLRIEELVTARYVHIEVLSNHGGTATGINEIRFYGVISGADPLEIVRFSRTGAEPLTFEIEWTGGDGTNNIESSTDGVTWGNVETDVASPQTVTATGAPAEFFRIVEP